MKSTINNEKKTRPLIQYKICADSEAKKQAFLKQLARLVASNPALKKEGEA